MVTQSVILDFLAQKKIAVVGVSRDAKKFANTAYRLLKARGYKIFPVNPFAENIEGDRCYSNVKALPEKADSALIMLPPEKVMDVLNDVAEAGIKYVWIQQHSESEQAILFCQNNGIKLIHGECIIMFSEPVGFAHRLHRWGKKMTGTLPKD